MSVSYAEAVPTDLGSLNFRNGRWVRPSAAEDEKGGTAFWLRNLLTTLGALTLPTLAQEADSDGVHGRMSGSGKNGGSMMQMMGQMHGMMAPGMMGDRGMMGGMGMMGDHGMMSGMGAMSGVMQAFDTDGDGTVTPEEVRSGLENRLAEFDADNSGTLSIDEFEALHSAMVRETMVDRFQAFDNDGDGEVTPEEITAPADQMQRMQRMQESRTQMQERNPDRQPATPMDGTGTESGGVDENTGQPGGATEQSGG